MENLAEQHLKELRIGRRYTIEKMRDFDSVIKE